MRTDVTFELLYKEELLGVNFAGIVNTPKMIIKHFLKTQCAEEVCFHVLFERVSVKMRASYDQRKTSAQQRKRTFQTLP